MQVKRVFFLATAAGCLALYGCTTTAAKHALNKPTARDKFSGFDSDAADDSKRKAPRREKIDPDADPETAVAKLVEQLQKDRARAVYAEEQLRYWGSKQGVGKIVAGKVRLLLKNENIEVRAPALRLTMQFGGNEVNGDLVECLADPEYGMRATAYKALKARTGMDFGFSPAGGEITRADAVQKWRQWWQAEQRRIAVKDPSIYELKAITEPRVERIGDESGRGKVAGESQQEHESKDREGSENDAAQDRRDAAPAHASEANSASEFQDPKDEDESRLFLKK